MSVSFHVYPNICNNLDQTVIQNQNTMLHILFNIRFLYTILIQKTTHFYGVYMIIIFDRALVNLSPHWRCK